MKDKITVTIRDDKHEYSEIIKDEDFNNLMEEFEECKRNGANPLLSNLTFKEYTKTVTDLTFNSKRMAELNGIHFIYGWIESFFQSKDIMEWMSLNDNIKIDVFRSDEIFFI